MIFNCVFEILKKIKTKKQLFVNFQIVALLIFEDLLFFTSDPI